MKATVFRDLLIRYIDAYGDCDMKYLDKEKQSHSIDSLDIDLFDKVLWLESNK